MQFSHLPDGLIAYLLGGLPCGVAVGGGLCIVRDGGDLIGEGVPRTVFREGFTNAVTAHRQNSASQHGDGGIEGIVLLLATKCLFEIIIDEGTTCNGGVLFGKRKPALCGKCCDGLCLRGVQKGGAESPEHHAAFDSTAHRYKIQWVDEVPRCPCRRHKSTCNNGIIVLFPLLDHRFAIFLDELLVDEPLYFLTITSVEKNELLCIFVIGECLLHKVNVFLCDGVFLFVPPFPTVCDAAPCVFEGTGKPALGDGIPEVLGGGAKCPDVLDGVVVAVLIVRCRVAVENGIGGGCMKGGEHSEYGARVCCTAPTAEHIEVTLCLGNAVSALCIFLTGAFKVGAPPVCQGGKISVVVHEVDKCVAACTALADFVGEVLQLCENIRRITAKGFEGGASAICPLGKAKAPLPIEGLCTSLKAALL